MAQGSPQAVVNPDSTPRHVYLRTPPRRGAITLVILDAMHRTALRPSRALRAAVQYRKLAARAREVIASTDDLARSREMVAYAVACDRIAALLERSAGSHPGRPRPHPRSKAQPDARPEWPERPQGRPASVAVGRTSRATADRVRGLRLMSAAWRRLLGCAGKVAALSTIPGNNPAEGSLGSGPPVVQSHGPDS